MIYYLFKVLHSREFRNIVAQESYAQLLANGINDVYSLVSAGKFVVLSDLMRAKSATMP